MKTFRSIPLALLFVSSTAWADLPIKIGLGPVFDLQGDPVTQGDFRCTDPIGNTGESWDCGAGPPIGGRLLASARIRLSDRAAIRVGPRLEGGTRSGAVSFQCGTVDFADGSQGGPGVYTEPGYPCGGPDQSSDRTVQTGGHFAATVLIGLAVGPEFAVPVGSNSLYFGAELSAGVAWSFDSLGPEATDNPDQIGKSPSDGVIDDFSNDGCLDCSVEARGYPAFFGAEILAGYKLGGGTPLFFEAAYSTARIGQFQMEPDYDVTGLQSLAYTWNPIRLTVGVELEL